MTDRSKEKETVKVMLRSLLISSPMELPIRQVLKDYHSFVGKALDYRGLGYPTPEEFFRDMEDTVMIGWKHGAMTLRAVADEKTMHIQKLVSKQKVSSKQKSAVNRQIMRDQQWNNSNYRAPRFSRGGLLPPPRVVPAYVRNQIMQLFRSYPDGIAFRSFDAAFVRQFGCRLNFAHYGFNTWEQFLDAIRDLVSVKQTQYGDWKIVPVPRLIESNSYKRPYESSSYRQYQEPETNPVSENKSQGEVERRRRPSRGRGRGRKHSGNSEASVGSAGSNDSEKSQARKDQLELEIQQVLEDKPDGIWASKFPDAFKEKHGRPLDYFRHGYLSVIEFVNNACDVVHIERPTPQGDWKLYDARMERPAENKSQNKQQTSEYHKTVLEKETKENIRILLKDQSEGVSMKEFPKFYKENTGMELQVTELGYDTADDYFLSLADSVLQIKYIKGALMIYSVDIDVPMNNQETVVEHPVQPNCPTDVVGPGCHYTPIMCPNTFEYAGIFVSNIINPGLFWVILRHKQNSLALEALMNDIDDFYNHEIGPDEYLIPESMVCPGQVCAVLFPEDNNWHRGVVTKVNQEGFAGIYYVDYGNTAFVNKKAVKFLKSEFLKLPVQAIQARLANIVPSSGKWKVKSRNRMLELVKERPLIAYVTDVKTQILSLCLTDTSDPEIDLHINDVLVSEGYAIFKPDEEITEEVTKEQHKEVPDYCHVFGWNIKEAPRLPHVAGKANQEDVDNSNVQPEQQEYCYVKWLQLTKDRIIHLINLERVAYVVSAELSSFFWENDILGSMLKRNNIEARKRTVSSDNYPKLFEELTKYNVKSFGAEMMGKRRFISLYELNCVPVIIRTFLPEDEELVTVIEDLINKFDPDSPYWKDEELVTVIEDLINKFDPDSPYWKTGESPTKVDEMIVADEIKTEKVDDNNVDAGETDETINLSVDEKQMVLQALQFKRKRILQTLMSTPGCSNDLVNELNNCELEIMMLKQQLESTEGKGGNKESQDKVSGVKSTGSQQVKNSSPTVGNQSSAGTQLTEQTTQSGTLHGEDKRAETERVIQNIINSTTKPIATANIVTKATTSMSVSQTGSTVTNCLPNNQFVTQSTTGSNPGMIGLAGSQGIMGVPGSQQQGFINPMLMAQPGMMPNPRLMNLQNLIMAQGGNMAVPPNMMMPGFQQGFPLQINPMNQMFQAQVQFPQLTNGNLVPMQGNLNQVGGAMPSVGRGQPLGILPGLLPLFQNLTVGRGRGGGQ